MKLFELYASLGLDDAKFSQGISSSRTKFASFASSVGSGVTSIASGADKVITKMTSIVKKASLAVVGVGALLAKTGLTYNQQMEDYTNTFTVMLGSAEDAAKKVEELKKFAAATPFSMADLADSTKTLLAFNVSSEKSTGIMKMLGDVALGNADKFSRLSTAYGKANSLGKLTGEVYQQMVEAGFNPLNVIAQETGESMEELQKRMAAGKISVSELEKAFKKATSEGGQFYKGMESASKTTSGLISTLKDNAQALVGEILTPLSNWVKDSLLPTAIDYVQQFTDAFSQGGDAVKNVAAKIMSEVLGKVTSGAPNIINTITDIITGMLDVIDINMDGILNAGSAILGALFDGMNQIMPRIAELAGEIAPMIFAAILTFDAEMLQAGINIIASIASGMAANADAITSGVSNIVGVLLDTITTSLPVIIDSGLKVLVAIMKGLSENSDKISEAITTVIDAIITYVTENLPDILDAGIDILLAIIDGIINSLPLLAEKVPEIINEIVDKLKERWPEIEAAGKELLKALGRGIWSIAGNLAADISNWISSVFGGENVAFKNGSFYLANPEIHNSRGSYATGLDYVPYDNFPANLHAGEAVLPKPEATEWRKGKSSDSAAHDGAVIYHNTYIYANDTSYAEQERIQQRQNQAFARELISGAI